MTALKLTFVVGHFSIKIKNFLNYINLGVMPWFCSRGINLNLKIYFLKIKYNTYIQSSFFPEYALEFKYLNP
jgi:hypothetical protein